MIEHMPWIGSNYEEGIDGQKIAISGYSHWGDGHESDDVTVECVEHILDGSWQISFFDRIQSYFGYQDRSIFWNSVLFFNFVPSLVGGAQQRYAWATAEQKKVGQERVLRIIEDHKPDKLFVFTRKGWCSYPKTTEEARGEQCLPLGIDQSRAFTYGHYLHSGGTTIAYGLRHPQFARFDAMRAAVQLASR